MRKHVFGGDWTTDKLERVRKYLRAYTTIFKSNPAARNLRTTYVDAFAGSGARVDTKNTSKGDESPLFDLSEDADAESFKKGSARIALEVEPPFDNYVFVERREERAAELASLAKKFPTRHAQIKKEDANEFLRSWCSQMDWTRNRAVVFLDPYGMQVEWSTIEVIADTGAIDLWWLVPVGIGLNRLLTSGGLPPPGWATALTRTLGTESWKAAFYAADSQGLLFADQDTGQHKIVDVDKVGNFVVGRLKSIFAGVVSNPLTLQNSRKTPIYLLCFAAGNPKGAKTAVKIAQDILKA